MSTATAEYVETRTSDEPGDSAHIVMVPPGEKDETPQAYVMRARVEGFAITAVCGYRWVPERDPQPLPVCAKCLEFYQNNGRDLEDRQGPPDA